MRSRVRLCDVSGSNFESRARWSNHLVAAPPPRGGSDPTGFGSRPEPRSYRRRLGPRPWTWGDKALAMIISAIVGAGVLHVVEAIWR